ncbi:hypothetical protein IWX92DRAFT_380181 [Phyllosticta citricarpa]
MKLFNVILFAATATAAAIPMPVNEADVEALRARGVSEADIAHALQPSPANPVASLLRRNIDADAEVRPAFYSSPHPQLTRRWDTAATESDMRAVQADDSLNEGSKAHRLEILRFMDSLARGHLSSIAVGQGGTALKKKREEAAAADEGEKKRSVVGGNGNWHFGAMNMGVPKKWSWRHKSGSSSSGSAAAAGNSNNANSATNANSANTKALATTSTANKASTAGKGARDPEAAELTRPESLSPSSSSSSSSTSASEFLKAHSHHHHSSSSQHDHAAGSDKNNDVASSHGHGRQRFGGGAVAAALPGWVRIW